MAKSCLVLLLSITVAFLSCDFLPPPNSEGIDSHEAAKSIISGGLTVTNFNSEYVNGTVHFVLSRPPGSTWFFTLKMNDSPVAGYSSRYFNSPQIYFDWNTTQFPEGSTNKFELICWDGNTNIQHSEGFVTLTVANHPGQGITSPTANQNCVGNSIHAVTTYSGADIEKVEFMLDGIVTDTDSEAPFDAVVSFPPGTQGSHTISAKAYTIGSPSPFRVTSVPIYVNNPVSVQNIVGDYDGDKKSDLVTLETYRDQFGVASFKGYYYKALSNGFQGGIAFLPNFPAGITSLNLAGVKDVSNDGKDDIVFECKVSTSTYWVVCSFNSSGQAYSGIWTYTSSANATTVGIGDTTGDGIPDLVIQADISGGTRIWKTRRSNGTSFIDPGYEWTNTQTPDVWNCGLADADGDGKADLLLSFLIDGIQYWQIRKSTGTSFVPITPNSNWSYSQTPNISTLNNNLINTDLTGDGRADLFISFVHDGVKYWQVRQSTGTSYLTGVNWTYTGTLNAFIRQLADFDKNGLPDLLIQYEHDGQIYFQLRANMGFGRFETGVDWANITGFRYVGFGDVDLDGRLDLFLTYYDSNSGLNYLQVRKNSGSGFVVDPSWQIAVGSY